MPSNMVINMESRVGNNELKRAGPGMKLGVNSAINMPTKPVGVHHMSGAPPKTHRPNNHSSNPLARKPTKQLEIPVVSNPGEKEAQPTINTHDALKIGIATAKIRNQAFLPRNFTTSLEVRKTKLTIAPIAPGRISAIFLPSAFRPLPTPPAISLSSFESALIITPMVALTTKASAVMVNPYFRNIAFIYPLAQRHSFLQPLSLVFELGTSSVAFIHAQRRASFPCMLALAFVVCNNLILHNLVFHLAQRLLLLS